MSFKKKYTPWNKGKIGFLKGRTVSSETREKLKLARAKQIFSKKDRIKMSKARIGKKNSETTRKKISDSLKSFYDKKGRKIYKRYIHLTATKEYKKWRSDVFSRDNWTCQTCRARGCYLEAHHIKSWAKYPELRFDVNNGVALCRDCHKLTDNYKNKKQ